MQAEHAHFHRQPWLKGTVSYPRSESILGTPIKVEPWTHESFMAPLPPMGSTNQIPQVAQIIAARSLKAPNGGSDPQPPLASHIPGGLASLPPPAQRKRKMDVGAGDGEETEEERPPAHKRQREALFRTLPEAPQSEEQEGKQNEHERPPVQPRRSSRIQERNKKCTVLPKVENPAKPASRKRAVRKK